MEISHILKLILLHNGLILPASSHRPKIVIGKRRPVRVVGRVNPKSRKRPLLCCNIGIQEVETIINIQKPDPNRSACVFLVCVVCLYEEKVFVI